MNRSRTHFGRRLTAGAPILAVLTASLSPVAGAQPCPFEATIPQFQRILTLVENEPRSVVTADFDGDGADDLAVATTSGTFGLSVYLNSGDGIPSFPTANYVADTEVLTTGDFDGDGSIDIGVLVPDSNDVGFLLNDGTGTFGPIQVLPIPSTGLARWIAAADFNLDGRDDLVVRTSGFTTTTLILNLSELGGGFSPPVTIDLGFNGPRDIADMDDDGVADIIVCDDETSATDDRVRIFFGVGDGSFETAVDVLDDFGGAANGVAAGDLDGDGDLDLAVTVIVDTGSFSPPEYKVRLYDNDGTGAMSYAGETDYESQVLLVDVVDVSGDGLADIVTNSGEDLTVLVSDGGTIDPIFALRPRFGFPEVAGFTILDADNDGWPDALATNPTPGDRTLNIAFGDGSGLLLTDRRYAAGSSDSVDVADFDGDGLMDVLANDYNGDMISIFLGRTDGLFESRATSPSLDGPSIVRAADMNGDGSPDAVALAIDGSVDRLDVHLNAGDGSIAAVIPNEIPGGANDMEVTDVDNDGVPDVVTVRSSLDVVRFHRGNGDGSLAPAVDVGVLDFAIEVEVGDIDGDGRRDILAIGLADAITIYYQAADGSFPSGTEIPLPSFNIVDFVLGDIDLDGDVDIVAVSSSGALGTVRSLVNLGGGSFDVLSSGLTPGSGSPNSVALGDLDGDGLPDLVLTNDRGGMLRNLGDGTFGEGRAIDPVARSRSVRLIDADGSGSANVIAIDNDGLSVLLNRCVPGTSGDPDPEAGDYNGDGIVDLDDLVLVIGNWGVADPSIELPGDGDDVVGFEELVSVLTNWTGAP